MLKADTMYTDAVDTLYTCYLNLTFYPCSPAIYPPLPTCLLPLNACNTVYRSIHIYYLILSIPACLLSTPVNLLFTLFNAFYVSLYDCSHLFLLSTYTIHMYPCSISLYSCYLPVYVS